VFNYSLSVLFLFSYMYILVPTRFIFFICSAKEQLNIYFILSVNNWYVLVPPLFLSVYSSYSTTMQSVYATFVHITVK
jgi:hypothetical protein